MEKIAILGASTGFGNALAHEFHKKDYHLFLSSRKEELLLNTATKFNSTEKITDFFVADFTNKEDQENLFLKLNEFAPDHIIYCAGGGAYGNFEDKKWNAHQWTFELNFLFPAKLLYHCLNDVKLSGLQNIIFIGSQIADNKPDAMAASYCASKHALRGLITSVQNENPQRSSKLRLFSAPYMNTSMLPLKSWPRQVTGLVQEPETVAETFFNWFKSEEQNYE